MSKHFNSNVLTLLNVFLAHGCVLLTSISFDVLFSESDTKNDLRMELWGLNSKSFDRLENSESAFNWSTALLLPWLVFVKSMSVKS